MHRVPHPLKSFPIKESVSKEKTLLGIWSYIEKSQGEKQIDWNATHTTPKCPRCSIFRNVEYMLLNTLEGTSSKSACGISCIDSIVIAIILFDTFQTASSTDSPLPAAGLFTIHALIFCLPRGRESTYTPL